MNKETRLKVYRMYDGQLCLLWQDYRVQGYASRPYCSQKQRNVLQMG